MHNDGAVNCQLVICTSLHPVMTRVPSMQAAPSGAQDLSAKKALLESTVASFCAGDLPLQEVRQVLHQVGSIRAKNSPARTTCTMISLFTFSHLLKAEVC